MEQQARPRRRRIAIREMEIDDLPAVFHLGSRLFTSAEFPTLYRTWDEYEVITYYNTDPEFCLVAEREGGVVGFVLGTTYEKMGSAWKYGYVAWIGVDPGQRRAHIARRLYDVLERRMARDGVRIMLMDTQANNQDAIRFFSRMGFGKPTPQVWMSKTLSRVRRKDVRGKARGGGPRPVRVLPPQSAGPIAGEPALEQRPPDVVPLDLQSKRQAASS